MTTTGSATGGRSVIRGAMTETTTECGFRPFPGSGAYGHWTCDLPSRHRGRHRFINYTIARIPRLHSGVRRVVAMWWRSKRRTVAYIIRYRRLSRVDISPQYRQVWHRAIWPTEYDPV